MKKDIRATELMDALGNIDDELLAEVVDLRQEYLTEKEKKPQHYDIDGRWYSQADKENPYDIVSKVEDKAVLGDVLEDLHKAENELLDQIRCCQDHKMDMEVAALRYKCNAIEQFRSIIYKHKED